jgi:hypothetical protein
LAMATGRGNWRELVAYWGAGRFTGLVLDTLRALAAQ